ncbi:right-handed parallel beta-helix repeat-containing protein [Candidatus Poribacteria bacterium]|nr:right-handed parallel beta-helix repeat-containing protein [Candidatus Poribacteria bacterium]
MKLRQYTYLMITISVLCYTPLVFSAVIQVPADQPTIQSGIDAAVNGDTVLVADGIYKGEGNVNIDFNGKKIIVKSQNGPKETIIDSEENVETRGFTFQNDETRDSVLDGFTIKNGNHQYSGGIYGSFSSPTIKNCIITGNHGSGVYLSGGLRFDAGSPNPILIDCIISDNVNHGVYSLDHLIIEIKGCTISRNSGRGVVFTENYSIKNNIITDSIIEQNGKGGIELSTNSNLKITDSIVSQNTGDVGGGITCSRTCTLDISKCLITDNTANRWGGGLGLESWSGSVTISYSTISQNSAGTKGGGIYFSSTPANSNVLSITNSIVWNNNSDDTHPEAFLSGNGITIKSSDIKDGLQGIKRVADGKLFVYEDNIDTDPLFVNAEDGDYNLKPNSPAAAMGAHAIVNNQLSVNSIGKKYVQWGEIKKRKH